MADDLVINARVTIPGDELEYAASRASGPGGQHVNTSDTKVEVRWNPTTSAVLSEQDRQRLMTALTGRLTSAGDLVLSCGTHRSQRRNRLEVLDRLAEVLRTALQPRRRRIPTRATKASKQRRREDKKRRSSIKKLRRKPSGDD